jgi:hypothetical protein
MFQSAREILKMRGPTILDAGRRVAACRLRLWEPRALCPIRRAGARLCVRDGGLSEDARPVVIKRHFKIAERARTGGAAVGEGGPQGSIVERQPSTLLKRGRSGGILGRQVVQEARELSSELCVWREERGRRCWMLEAWGGCRRLWVVAGRSRAEARRNGQGN